MYTELYPHLNVLYNFGNFEEIAQTLDKNFKGLFNLDALENEAKLGNKNGSYAHFFDLIMPHLRDLYTPGEISTKLYQILHTNPTIRNCFLERLIFVPPVGAIPSKQLSFHEKLATGELKIAEPVSFLDMLRITHYLQALGSKHSYSPPGIEVLNLDTIDPEEASRLLSSNQALMINFNRDSQGTPKWGVLDLRDDTRPQVYCETPLLEAEKKELEQRLGIVFNEVSAGKTDSLPSTGYTAIAWLDQNITHGWNFDPNADFNVLLGDYIFAQFRGDGGGIHFETLDNEYDRYFTKELRAINKARYGKDTDPDPDSKQWGGFSPIKLAAMTMLGEMEGVRIEMNDMAQAVKIVGGNNLSQSQCSSYISKAYRSNIPRFDYTLAAFGNPIVLQEYANSVSLTVPSSIDRTELEEAHSKACRVTETNAYLLSYLSSKASRSWEEDAATAMVLTLFRARAKKKEIEIALPQTFQLSREEKVFITNLMQENPYVSELKVNNNNSLKELKEVLLPVFARNRWLAEKGYRPPMVDNYWQRAAKYWLLHLNEHSDLLEEKIEHETFKRCVKEMGLIGLKAVLNFLNDESQRETLEGIYAKNKPVFYAACQKNETQEYLTALIRHLDNHAYFPFAEIAVAYQPGNDRKFLEFFDKINRLEQFQQVKITNCFENFHEFSSFLFKLTKEARQHNWTGLIVIPELEDQNNVGEMHRELRAIYANLNNVILHNRHNQAAANLISNIKATSDFSEPGVVEPPKKAGALPKADSSAMSIDEAFSAFKLGKEQGPWPIKRGGVVQLQLQQQQQIQQSREIQQEQQKMQMHVMEEVIVGERVTYDNIGKLLGDYYRAYKAENFVDETSAACRQNGESILKGFFHTWINANPTVNAPNVIHSMTMDAAKMLLRKHTRFSSGLSLDNLPKGFYTQRAKDGSLILCYSPEVGYVNGTNPFTVELNVNVPIAKAWEGDFRLFDIEKYIDAMPELTKDDFQSLILFARLQPSKNYKEELAEFLLANPEVKKKIDAADRGKAGFIAGLLGGAKKENLEKVTNNWLVFLQAWQYAGMKGVEQFLALSEEELTLDLQDAYAILFKNQSAQIREWVNTTHLSEEHLRAIGQVYYRFGDEAVSLLLAKFRQIDSILGREFFTRFSENGLSQSENYDCFISERFFSAMDDMLSKLQPKKAEGSRLAWLTVLSHHLNTVSWENIETLWKAFDYFVSELAELGLELRGDEFDDIKPENMLVCLDRILETLKRIPSQDQKVAFLRRLPQLQLEHGGVHYAIVHEGFKYFDDNLQLHDFARGTPTYKPDLTDLYNWSAEETKLNINRTLASRSQFSHQAFDYLTTQLNAGNDRDKDNLVWLLMTQSEHNDIEPRFNELSLIEDAFRTGIAKHLHTAFFDYDNKNLQVSQTAMVALEAKVNSHANFQERFTRALQKFPYGTFLEASSILWNAQRWEQFHGFLNLFDTPMAKESSYPDALFRDGYKLAVLFGINDAHQLQAFYRATQGLKPVVQNELRLLINQLMSIDYANSDLAQLQNPQNWTALLECIQSMKGDLRHVAVHRIQLIEKYNQGNINFKYSKSGEFRVLKNDDNDRPNEIGFFVDHQDRLWNFMVEHIAVPVNADAKESLQPLLRFFKKLQLNRTYLNEIEPLLTTLEKTPKGQLWTASYFYQMLKVLQPDDDQASFPIPMMEVLLNDITVGAKLIDSVEKDFPQGLVAPIQGILKNTIFTRPQQNLLCELALKEFDWQKSSRLLTEIIALLSPDQRALSREYALRILAKSETALELESRLDKTRWLLEHPVTQEVVGKNWTKTTALWLKALSTRESEEQLFTDLRGKITDSEEKRALVLHILAWSCLHPGLKDADAQEYELSQKAPKVMQKLAQMTVEDLVVLAKCYPSQPSPTGEDILHLLKKQQQASFSWKTIVDQFLRHPHSEPRMDYKVVAKTREADLQRMFAETKITNEHGKIPLPADKAAKLSIVFANLKQLQAGTALVTGTDKPVEDLSQEEIATAFRTLSLVAAKEPDNHKVSAEIWALMFEALGRTTRKYPHLAQQFALIANDTSINSNSRVLQLATGEGKSHFVAMRAAKHAGMGKTVDVCTAKRSLAERDLEDYQSLFDYLGLTSAYIHPKSARNTYTDAQIHYSTTGDISLFLDEQSFNGRPIDIDKRQRVALFDEFDFIRFEEGRKTEYNYARPTGKTPKQMTWFYQAVNKFYDLNQQNIFVDDGLIRVETLHDFAVYLQTTAGEDEDKQSIVNALLRDPLQLVRWLQSAHETAELTMGISFTVIEENIQVGDTSYPMKEIIPLSSDNQKMAGSTFSAGVQQLLAVRLNSEARIKGQTQNYHIHPESNIISSQVAAQRMNELWGSWEGFSGTISASQAQTLNNEEKTEVLHVSTNQQDLRAWHAPKFFKSERERLNSLVNQIRLCMERKQSILFSCKNDKQVTELQEALAKLLPPDLYANFIFYTNEDKMSPAEVLTQKRDKENWRGGKKQQAICLVASGFGRGDNVGVEAVFLFNVNDINDLLQKGGRTARNGEEGEVHQFYMTSELEQEKENLMYILAHTAGVDLAYVKEKLNEVRAKRGENLFQQVMLLREFVFNLQNAANQGYHAGVAQYSSWAMTLIGKFSDPSLRFDFTNRVTFSMKNLEKSWLDISSNPRLTPDQQVRAIEKIINAEARQLHQACIDNLKDSVAEVMLLDLKVYPSINLEIVVEKNEKISEHSKDLATICSKLASLPIEPKEQGLAEKFPLLLNELASYESELHKLTKNITACKSITDVDSLLTLALQQARNPSAALTELRSGAERKLTAKTLLKGVPISLKESFIEGLEGLLPELVERLIESLTAKSTLSRETRITNALPLINYLKTFSLEQQRQWGMDYVNHLDMLAHEASVEAMAMRLSGNPMGYKHSDSLWKLCSRFALKSELVDTWYILQRATGKEPEQRLRMLNKWEALALELDKQVASTFLANFGKVMTQFAEGQNWDSFSKLVDKTKVWWNKGDGKYQEELITLWQHLADNAENLPALNDTLIAGLKLSDKNWFQLLSIYTTLLPKEQVDRQPIFKIVLDHLEPMEKSSAEKRAIFQSLVHGFAERKGSVSTPHILAIIDKATQGSQVSEWLAYLIQLPKALEKTVKLEAREAFSRDILVFMRDKGFFDKLTVEQRKRCFEVVNQLTLEFENDDLSVQIMDLLIPYNKFLTKLTNEEAIGFKSTSFAKAAEWYLHFVKQHPAARSSLSLLLDDATSSISMECLSEELSRYSLSTRENTALLQMANSEKLTNKLFSDSCQYLANFNALMEKIERLGEQAKRMIKEEVLALPPAKLKELLKLVNDYQEAILANPTVLNSILDYGKKPAITASRFGLLAELMIIACGDEHCTQAKINHIKAGVDRFVKAETNDELIRLLSLLQRDKKHVEELLFDNVAAYLQNRVHDGQRNQVKGVVDFFYDLAVEHKGEPDLMFDLSNKRLAEMFDFTKQRKPLHDQRVIWMHLLNQHAFVTGKKRDEQHDNHAYQWDHKSNQALLQKGFDCYIKQTAKILEERGKASTSVNRDLSVKQQKALLQLSDELSIIGKPHLDLSGPRPAQDAVMVKGMEKAVDRLMSNYASSWFKSKERKVQFSKLQNEVAHLMADGNGMDEQSRYEKIYLAINAARLEAMDSDHMQNFNGSAKQNRGGSSRYFNTLNQMQDMVVRYWTQDMNAVQSFQVYKTHSRNELMGLITRLEDALSSTIDENDLDYERKQKHKVSRFFASNKHNLVLKDLHAELENFIRDNNAATIKQDDLGDLLKRLRQDKAGLPGHLLTLTNEILGRGDALLTHLQQELLHSTKSILVENRV